MNKEIKHKVTINAAPEDVYAALMDQKQHAGFTGEPAKISRKVGGVFNCYDGYINGINLELEPGQADCPGIGARHRTGRRRHYSIVTFRLAGSGVGKTTLTFTQTGVPAGDYARKNQGWRTHYWEPLKQFLERVRVKK